MIAAGAVYAYSFPGLFWLLGAAAIYAGDRARTTASVRRGLSPAALSAVAVAFGVLVVLTAPELGRIVDFTGFRAFSDSTSQAGSATCAISCRRSRRWGSGLRATSGSRRAPPARPAPAFYLGALVAGVALAAGLPRWIRRHGEALPAALAAAIVIYLGALAFGTVYTSAKALVIAAPLITLISLGGLLGQRALAA